eukprot:COSAG02_NODE_7225_length_3110_cov_4.343408_5_plen_49_part_01
MILAWTKYWRTGLGKGHTNEWEGEQALSELALEDALHCTLVRTNQTDQR